MNFLDSLIGRPNTIKTKRSLFTRHIEPHLPDDAAELDLPYVQSMAKSWLSEDLKPGTVRGLIALLKSYIQWKTGKAVDCSSVVRVVSKLQGQAPPKAWTKEEAKKAMDIASKLDQNFYKMLLVTLHTGMRKGELFGLKWGDLDIVGGKIQISRSYCGPTKNGKSRTVPMSDALELLVFNDYTLDKDDEHIFKRCDPNQKLEALCKATGVRLITWHGLRHTFATLALEAGVSPKVVSSALGHSKLSTTLDIYWHLTGEDIDLGFLP